MLNREMRVPEWSIRSFRRIRGLFPLARVHSRINSSSIPRCCEAPIRYWRVQIQNVAIFTICHILGHSEPFAAKITFSYFSTASPWSKILVSNPKLYASELCSTWIPTDSEVDIFRSGRPPWVNIVGGHSEKFIRVLLSQSFSPFSRRVENWRCDIGIWALQSCSGKLYKETPAPRRSLIFLRSPNLQPSQEGRNIS